MRFDRRLKIEYRTIKMYPRAIDGKVVLLGAMSVGKTSIVDCLLGQPFEFEKMSTIGSQYSTKQISTDRGPVTLRIWDTAGQERYRTLGPMYYQGSQVVIVVFSLVEPETLAEADTWVSEVRAHIQRPPRLILVGNKTDLPDRALSTDVVTEYAMQLGAEYFETSAKTGENIPALFASAADALLCPGGQTVTLATVTQPPARSHCC